MGGAQPWMFLCVALFAYLFNRVYTHYGSMNNPGKLWNWAVFLYNGKYFGITNFCLALTYLCLGSYYVKSEKTISRWACFALIILGVVMMHFETHKDVALGVPVIAFALFPLVKEWKIKCRYVSFKWLRKMSALVYFSHLIVITLIGLFLKEMNVLTWFVIEVGCIAFSAMLLWVEQFPCMSWVKKLY